MNKPESSSELSAAERECYAAEQRVRECLSELTPEHRDALGVLRRGAEINEFLESVEKRLNKSK